MICFRSHYEHRNSSYALSCHICQLIPSEVESLDSKVFKSRFGTSIEVPGLYIYKRKKKNMQIPDKLKTLRMPKKCPACGETSLLPLLRSHVPDDFNISLAVTLYFLLVAKMTKTIERLPWIPLL